MVAKTKKNLKKKAAAPNTKVRAPPKKQNKRTLVTTKRALPSCAHEYALSLADPFSTPPACLPLPPSLPSQKTKVFSRGSGAIGTAGFGFVTASSNLGNDSTLDNNPVFSSQSGWTGTSIALGSVIGVASRGTNSPFTNAELTSGNLGVRTVSMGLRLRYTGTELNRSGLKVAIEEPNHQTMIGKELSDMQAFDKGVSLPVDRSWITTSFQPVREDEYRFHSLAWGTGAVAAHFLGIGITGVMGETFEYEFVHNFEANGEIARSKTPSMTDRSATEHVINAFSYFSSADLSKVAQTSRTAAQVVSTVLNAYSSVTNKPRQALTY